VLARIDPKSMGAAEQDAAPEDGPGSQQLALG